MKKGAPRGLFFASTFLTVSAIVIEMNKINISFIEKDLKIELNWAEKIDTIAGAMSHDAELFIYWNNLINVKFSSKAPSEISIEYIDQQILHHASLYLSNSDIQIPFLTKIFLSSFILRGIITLEEKKGKIFNQNKEEINKLFKIRNEINSGAYHSSTIEEQIKSLMDKANIPSVTLSLIEIDQKNYKEKLTKLINESPIKSSYSDINSLIGYLACNKNCGDSMQKGNIIGRFVWGASEDLKLLFSYLKANISINKEIKNYIEASLRKDK